MAQLVHAELFCSSFESISQLITLLLQISVVKLKDEMCCNRLPMFLTSPRSFGKTVSVMSWRLGILIFGLCWEDDKIRCVYIIVWNRQWTVIRVAGRRWIFFRFSGVCCIVGRHRFLLLGLVNILKPALFWFYSSFFILLVFSRLFWQRWKLQSAFLLSSSLLTKYSQLMKFLLLSWPAHITRSWHHMK